MLLVLGCARPKTTVRSDDEAVKVSAPRVVASNQVQPWNVAVDATRVYWASKGKARKEEGAISSIAKSGGAITTIASKVSSPFGLAIANENLFFTCAVPEAPCIGDRDGLFEGAMLKEPWAIAVDEETLFWTDLSHRQVLAGPLTRVGPRPGFAGTQTIVATTEGRPVGLAVDATHVYWAASGPGVIARVGKSGGAIETLGHGDAPVSTDVYWSEWGGGRIVKSPKSGGEITVLAKDLKGTRGLVLDDGRAYFAHAGSILSVSKAGGAVKTHATGQKHVYALTIDATTIYWADLEAGTVMAIEK